MTRTILPAPFARALLLCALLALMVGSTGLAPREPVNGVARDALDHHAIVNATLIPEPGGLIEDATIVIRGGVIRSVRAGGEAPAGARVWDASGMLVHSAFIEPYLEVATPPIPDEAVGVGRHWNAKVMAERSALDAGVVPAGDADRLRGMGFAVAHIASDGGVFRGSSALVTLIPDDGGTPPESRVLNERFGHVVALSSGGFTATGFPGSRMGVIALVRQTLSDADWYESAERAHASDAGSTPRPAPQDALVALRENLPWVFPVADELDFLRTSAIAREFARDAVIVGSGDEYRRLDAVVGEGRTMIVPLAFASAPGVSTEGQRVGASLRELMMWEQSPTNVRRLADAGARVVLTSSRLPDGQRFMPNLRKAIAHGLDRDRALAMLTTESAEVLGEGDRLGRVAPGFAANLVVRADAEHPFDEGGEVRDLWIDGVRHEINTAPEHDYAGVYDVTLVNPDEPQRGPIVLEIGKGSKGFSFEATDATLDEPETETLEGREVSVFENRFGGAVTDPRDPGAGSYLVDFIVEGDRVVGTSRTPTGGVIAWAGTKRAPGQGDEGEEDGAGDDEPAPDVPESFGLPMGAYAFEGLPESGHVILRNATVWTADGAGIIEGGEVEMKDGVIAYVGRARRGTPDDATELDMTGKHVTP
ncbi:MAG: amidohydrolase family protein, partial [Planctomycetota bacterium]